MAGNNFISHDPLQASRDADRQMLAELVIKSAVGPMGQEFESAGVPKEVIDMLRKAPGAAASPMVQQMATNPQLLALMNQGGFVSGRDYMTQNAMAFTGGINPMFAAANAIPLANQAHMAAADLSNELFKQSHMTAGGKMTAGINRAMSGGMNDFELQEFATQMAMSGASGTVTDPKTGQLKSVRVDDIMADSGDKAEVVLKHARAMKVMMDQFDSPNWKAALETYRQVTGNSMARAGGQDQMMISAIEIGAIGQISGMGTQATAMIAANTRQAISERRYGGAQGIVEALYGGADSWVGMKTADTAGLLASEYGLKGEEAVAMGRSVGAAMAAGDDTSGGRAIRAFEMMVASGDVKKYGGKDKVERMRRMLDQGDMEGFTKSMRDLSVAKFGSAEMMDRITSSDKALGVFESNVREEQRKKGNLDTFNTVYNEGMKQTFEKVYTREQILNTKMAGAYAAEERVMAAADEYGVDVSDEDRAKMDKTVYESGVKQIMKEVADLEKGDKNDQARARTLRANLYKMDRQWKESGGDLSEAMGAIDDTGVGLEMQAMFINKQSKELGKMVEKEATTDMMGLTLDQVDEYWEELGDQNKWTNDQKAKYAELQSYAEKRFGKGDKADRYAKAQMLGQSDGLIAGAAGGDDKNAAARWQMVQEDLDKTGVKTMFQDMEESDQQLKSAIEQDLSIAESIGSKAMQGITEEQRTEWNIAKKGATAGKLEKAMAGVDKKIGETTSPGQVAADAQEAAREVMQQLLEAAKAEKKVKGTLKLIDVDTYELEGDEKPEGGKDEK